MTDFKELSRKRGSNNTPVPAIRKSKRGNHLEVIRNGQEDNGTIFRGTIEQNVDYSGSTFPKYPSNQYPNTSGHDF